MTPAELKTDAAMLYLNLKQRAYRTLDALPRRKAQSNYSGRRPWMYSTEHLNRVAVLMREAKLSLPAACRVVAAEIQGRL